MTRVLCVGGAVVDQTYRLVGGLVAGTSNPAVTSPGFGLGGVARNVAENLVSLGVEVDLVSAVGADAEGDALLARLAELRIGTRDVAVRAGASTARYVAVLDPSGDLAVGLAAMDVFAEISCEQLDPGWPRGRSAEGAWVFCDANLPAAVLEHAVARPRAEGTGLVLDAVSVAKAARLPADLTGVALLGLNLGEARAYLHHHGRDAGGAEEEVAVRLLGSGSQAVLVTLGAAGLLLARDGQVQHLPTEPVTEVVDVTGAGDALLAATLAGLAAGADLVVAVQQGIRRAAATVASARSVLPGPEA